MDSRYPIAVVLEEVLRGVNPALGRMACLARCCDTGTGEYRHVNLFPVLEDEEANKALAVAHGIIWRDWLCLPLEQQQADLPSLHSQPGRLQDVLRVWKHTQPFLAYVPACAREEERELFTDNLAALLAALSREHSSSPVDGDAPACDSQSPVPQMPRSIHEMQSDPLLTLASISDSLHISERHLGRTLRAHTGQTFRQYLRGVRMKQAAALLETSNHGVKTVSAMVGYSDPSHFARYFRQATGRTPAQYKKERHVLALQVLNSTNS